MTLVERIVKSSMYIGYLELLDDDTMIFVTPHLKRSGQRDRKFFYELGDIVYFMFIEGQLMKIGKAAGQGGWYSRMTTYGQGIRGDRTNKMIINKMRESGHTRIDILGIKAPRTQVTIKCPISNDERVIDVETAIEIERALTKEFLSESTDNVLPFCTQLD